MDLRPTKSGPNKLAVSAGIVVLSVSLSFGATTTTKHLSKSSKASHRTAKKSHRTRGQQAIDGERARQIQEALVREHYMTGQPTGKWDEATQQAMRRYQADQGWQNKSVPDSRALIRLGLGPDKGHLLNPETAMTTEPQLPHGTRGQVRAASLSSSMPSAQPASAAHSSALPAQGSTASIPISSLPDLSPSR